jgi:hypothetical protein
VWYVRIVEINDSIQEKTNALYEESEEIHQCLKEAEERVELVSLLREHHTANPVPMTDQLQHDVSFLQETLKNSSELKKEVEKMFEEFEVRLHKHLMIQRIEKEL